MKRFRIIKDNNKYILQRKKGFIFKKWINLSQKKHIDVYSALKELKILVNEYEIINVEILL